MTTSQSPPTRQMKISGIITSKRMAWIALAAAIGYAIAGFAIGGDGILLVILCMPPLLLLGGVLLMRWQAAAWIGAVLGLAISLFGLLIGPIAGGILAVIGLAAFVSELPRLRHPHEP
ncbi:MAG TPA: hypothetical protein VF843_02365, partial [Streptosporangiaceae bacterium]